MPTLGMPNATWSPDVSKIVSHKLAAEAGEPATILVVEDNIDDQNLLKRQLAKSGVVERHRETLKNRAEVQWRLHELDRWRESSLFTKREKAALSLSESISLKQPKEILEKVLNEARSHFEITEIVSLTLGIMAINDWLDLHSEPRLRVLVVEDSPFDQELLRRQLKKTQIGENAIFVSDAHEALVLLEDYQKGLFDWELLAIFLDIHMPGMTGIELLQHIRLMPGMDDLPVIVMTSSNDPRDIEECRRLRVMGYVEKPVTYQLFSNAIANLFHRTAQPANRLPGRVE